MLKFKQIKRSIIRPQDNTLSPIAQTSKYNSNNQKISFKAIRDYQEYSPLQKRQLNNAFNVKFDTDKKHSVTAFQNFDFKSDSKENNPKTLYYNKETFGNLGGKKLEFGHVKRKVRCVEQPSQYDDKSYENSATKNGNLSFTNLLQSKKPTNNCSKNKNYLQSQRKNERQSSISKLKQKLFGMKKVISEKQKDIQIKRDCPTDRKMSKRDHFIEQNDDIVKISIKNDSPPHELDMAPYF